MEPEERYYIVNHEGVIELFSYADLIPHLHEPGIHTILVMPSIKGKDNYSGTSVLKMVIACLKYDEKILAIKFLRDMTGGGLAWCKTYCDNIQEFLNS